MPKFSFFISPLEMSLIFISILPCSYIFYAYCSIYSLVSPKISCLTPLKTFSNISLSNTLSNNVVLFVVTYQSMIQMNLEGARLKQLSEGFSLIDLLKNQYISVCELSISISSSLSSSIISLTPFSSYLFNLSLWVLAFLSLAANP